jgi:hypothetical protein
MISPRVGNSHFDGRFCGVFHGRLLRRLFWNSPDVFARSVKSACFRGGLGGALPRVGSYRKRAFLCFFFEAIFLATAGKGVPLTEEFRI